MNIGGYSNNGECILSFNFEVKDQEIFTHLHKNPFQSYNKISKRVNLAPATVKHRFKG